VPLLLREVPDLFRATRVLGDPRRAEAVVGMLELLRVARDAYAALQAHLVRHSLTDARWVLLMQLYAEPGGRLLPSTLAERLLVTRGAISGLVRGAERSGLVRRVAHPTDRRKSFVELRPRGRKLVRRVLPGHVARISAYMSVLTPAQRRSLTTCLRRLHTAIPGVVDATSHRIG
jgi:MarR family transcriptional repressor of emrRAB